MTLAEFSLTAKRLRPRLTALATRICGADCAEDAVQDTFLRLWDMRDRLDEYRSLDAFATVVCRNVSLDSVRARRPQTSLEDAADLAASRATAADAAIEAADAELTMNVSWQCFRPDRELSSSYVMSKDLRLTRSHVLPLLPKPL